MHKLVHRATVVQLVFPVDEFTTDLYHCHAHQFMPNLRVETEITNDSGRDATLRRIKCSLTTQENLMCLCERRCILELSMQDSVRKSVLFTCTNARFWKQNTIR
jgi:hypothetical protein